MMCFRVTHGFSWGDGNKGYKEMRVKPWVFVIACWQLAAAGQGETFLAPLDVDGQYFMGNSQDFEFDLGVRLLAVHDVKIDWEGSVHAGIGYSGDLMPNRFEAYLQAEPGYQLARGPCVGGQPWGPPEPFAAESEFDPHAGGQGWDFLLDGHANGRIQFANIVWIPEYPPQQLPVGYLQQATLIIDATRAGDLDDDGDVDLDDLALFLQALNGPEEPAGDPAADLDDDGDCDLADYAAFAAMFTGP